MARHVWLFLMLIFISTCALGMEKPKWQELPAVRCPVTSDRPKIDGHLDDVTWNSAVKLGPFLTQKGDSPKAPTVAMLAQDGQKLYIAFRCTEPDMAATQALRTKRDSDVWLDDCVEIFVDSNLDMQTYHHFIVSIANVQLDEACDTQRKGPHDVKWNGRWESAVVKGTNEWTVEVAIPFAEIGIRADGDTVIGLNVCRERPKDKEITQWSLTSGGFHAPAQFGTIILSRQKESPVTITLEQMDTPVVGLVNASVNLVNASDAELTVLCRTIVKTDLESKAADAAWFQLGPHQRAGGAIPVVISEGGPCAVALVFQEKASGRILNVRRYFTDIPRIQMEEFGALLPSPAEYSLWWAGSTNKVLKEMPLPKEKSDAVTISAAANEYEPFQIIFNAKRPLTKVNATITDFKSHTGTISANNVQIYRVAYVPVTVRSDRFGLLTDYPDPLPPLKEPFDVPAGENLPLWLVIKTPPNTKAGDYEGAVRITPSDAPTAQVKVKLHVYDFALTDETHTKTAYGVSPNWGFLGITKAEDKEKVFDYYMQTCRDHRIAPYNPMALHPLKYEITGPRRIFKNGPFEVICDEYARPYFTILWNGQKIGSLQNTMTQFTREGVGWKGTGVSWPGTDRIKEIKIVQRSPQRWVVDITGQKAKSSVDAKKYEVTFRFVFPAGQHWFSARMLRLVNTDEERFDARGYFYILNCAEEGAKKVQTKTHAVYLMKDTYLGIIEPTAQTKPGLGATHITRGARWLNPGEAIVSEQPHVIIFAGQGDKAACDAAAKNIIASLQEKSPEAFEPPAHAKITVDEKLDSSITFDFADFDRAAAKYLDGYKFNAFNFPAMPGQIGPFVRFEEGFKRLHKKVFGPIIEHLRQKGWLEKAYAYWFDEPEEKDYPYVIEGMDILKKNCPGLTRLLTEQVEPALIGHVDLWVPVLSHYDPLKCQLRQAHGEQVWWYVCCGPRAPYPNNFIDHPAINHRIRYWMMEKYGVTGDLYWSATYWHGKDGAYRSPWKDAMSVNPQGGHWGCGDGILLYPPCKEPTQTPVLDPPIISIRWEILREALEDKEYFWTLRQELARVRGLLEKLSPEKKVAALAVIRQAEHALGAPDRLAESLTEYTKNPKDIFRERERLALAIEACKMVHE